MGSAVSILDDFRVVADGDDIWTTDDEMGFLWIPGGNKSLEAKIVWPETADNGDALDPFCKAGIMYRESLSTNSRHLSIVRQKGGFTTTLARTATGGTTAVINNGSFENVTNLKLINTDGFIEAFYHNGSEYVSFGSTLITMPSTGMIGFCFSMNGATVTFGITEVITDGVTGINNKPANLIAHICSYESEVSESGNPFGKPLILQGHICSYESEADGSEPVPSPTTGFINFCPEPGGKQELNDNGSVYRNWMKIEAGTVANSITDKYWSANHFNDTTILWKINNEDTWRSTPLVDFVIPPAHRGKEIMITKITYGSVDYNGVTRTLYSPRTTYTQLFRI